MNGGPMNAERLLELYDNISEAPDAVERLRRFVLDLAVRGKLVEQDPADEPASVELERVEKLKAEHNLRKPKKNAPVKSAEQWCVTPFGWCWGRWDQVTNWITYGFTRPMQKSDDGVPVITGKNVNHGQVIFDTASLTPADLFDLLNEKDKPQPGDILVTKDGSIGRTAIVEEKHLPFCINQSVAVMWLRSCHFDRRYLQLVLDAPQMQLAFMEKAAGVAIKHISVTDLGRMAFPIPPLAEQHRIVAKVDELIALCDQLEAARKEREATRDRLTTASLARLTSPDTTQASSGKVETGFPSDDAQTDDSDFPAHAAFALNALPALTTRPDQIKTLRQTILNLAVRGKLVKCNSGSFESVGNYKKLQNGYAFKSGWFTKTGIRLLRNANIGHGDIKWTDTVYLPTEMAREYERFALAESDIVLTLDRPFIVTGTKVARLKATDLPSLLLQRVGRFVSVEKGLSDDYLFMWINSPHFNDQIDPGRSNGVPHISSKQVEAAEIFVPSLSEQHRIVAKVDELMALCDQLEAALTKTDTTRTRLLEALLHEVLEPSSNNKEAAE